MYWIYDIPNWQLCILTMGSFAIASLVAFHLVRPLVHRIVDGSGRHNDIVSYFTSGVSMLYGLTLGLIAVGTWQNFSDANSKASLEANSVGSLYRDLDAYPTEMREETEDLIRQYLHVVIEKEWPAHRQGHVLDDGELLLEKFENRIMAFEPTTETLKIAHAEVIQSLDSVIQNRGFRLQSVSTALPGVLWAVVLQGAVINLFVTLLFYVENRLLHSLLIATFASSLGMLIFLTAAMDNPYRGEFSVSPAAYEYVLNHVAVKPGS